jgi:predicted phosphodiesterase
MPARRNYTREQAKAAKKENAKRSEAKLKAEGESYRPRLSAAEIEVLKLAKIVGMERLTKELVVRATGLDLSGPDVENPVTIDLPESWAKKLPPYVIQGPRKILLIFDLHLPYHDKDKLKGALIHAKRYGCDCVVFGGDGLDNYKVSTYEKVPNAPSMQIEFQIGVEVLTATKQLFGPKCLYIYKLGNHEDRMDRYIMRNAPELWTEPGAAIADRLRLKELGYDLVLSQQMIEAGHLTILHGHEIKAGGQNPAQAKLKKALTNIIFGHHHKIDTAAMRGTNGKTIRAWGAGMLGAVEQDYAMNNQFMQGFAIVDLQADGTFSVFNMDYSDAHIRSA